MLTRERRQILQRPNDWIKTQDPKDKDRLMLLQLLECTQLINKARPNWAQTSPHPTVCLRLFSCPPSDTHLNPLMSRCCWDTQRKSSNLLDIGREIEQNTDVRKILIIQNNVTLSPSQHFPRMYTTDLKPHICILRLLTFCLPFLFGWWIWIWTKLFYALLSVCEKLVGGLHLTCLGLLSRQRFRGMWKTWGGWATHIHIHIHTYTQLVGTGRGMLATLLP